MFYILKVGNFNKILALNFCNGKKNGKSPLMAGLV